MRLTQTQPLQKVPKDAEVQLLSRKIIVHYCIGFGLNHSDVLMFFDVDRLSGYILFIHQRYPAHREQPVLGACP